MKKLSYFISFVLIAAFLLVVGIAVHDVFFPDDQLLLSAILNGSSSREPSSDCDGIDVSHHQGLIDWEAVSATKVQFVFLKATEGSTHVDRRFARNLLEQTIMKQSARLIHLSEGTDTPAQPLHRKDLITLEADDLAVESVMNYRVEKPSIGFM